MTAVALTLYATRPAALTGTGRLADDIWLLAHDDLTGRPFLHPRAVGLGVAAGLLAELVLIRAIRVSGDGVAATRRVRPQDGLMRAVHLRVLGERERHGTGDWLAFLARGAAQTLRRLGLPGWTGDNWPFIRGRRSLIPATAEPGCLSDRVRG